MGPPRMSSAKSRSLPWPGWPSFVDLTHQQEPGSDLFHRDLAIRPLRIFDQLFFERGIGSQLEDQLVRKSPTDHHGVDGGPLQVRVIDAFAVELDDGKSSR